MKSTDSNHNPQALELSCVLTSLYFNQDDKNPSFEITPTIRTDLEDACSFQMNWFKIFKEQKLKSSDFMCTVRDKKTGDIVGYTAGRYRPKDCDGSRVSIDFIERSPNSPKGYMIKLAIQFAYILAIAQDCKNIKISNPITYLIKYYEAEMSNPVFVQRGNHNFIMESLDANKIKEMNLPL
ncbi:hypothetical protein [Vibrio crassostreae]|uniref:hypothetical protein n=1 Tax=Vibrio crassostreae TaxID=246167 RepID=UPI001B305781|nr:hypothetical protein [Vibrio crassostreae]CAK2806030.1 hypothetical protein VCRA2113O23_250010 [Vibrio crassostreae]